MKGHDTANQAVRETMRVLGRVGIFNGGGHLLSPIKMTWMHWIGLLLAGGFLLAAPEIISPYFVYVFSLVGIYIIAALGLNLVSGYSGQIVIGWAGFFAIGAYSTAYAATKLGWPLPPTMLFSILLTGLIGFILGLPTLKLDSLYLGITTLGLGEIIQTVLINWTPVTGGPMGISGILAPPLFGFRFDARGTFYLVWFFALVGAWTMRRLTASPLGGVWVGIREDEGAAASLGADVPKFKMMAFVIGTMYAGLAGSLYAYLLSYISPESFTLTLSISMFAMIVIGGLGTIGGSIVGPIVLVVAPELLRVGGDWRLVMYGLALVTIIILRPRGILGRGGVMSSES